MTSRTGIGPGIRMMSQPRHPCEFVQLFANGGSGFQGHYVNSEDKEDHWRLKDSAGFDVKLQELSRTAGLSVHTSLTPGSQSLITLH